MEISRFRMIPRKHNTIPNLDGLQRRLDAMWTVTHEWGEPQIIDFYMANFHAFSTIMEPVVKVERVCKVCESKRHRKLYYREGYWHTTGEAMIFYSPQYYKASLCQSRRKNREGKRKESVKSRRLIKPQESKEQRREKWKQNQETKNLHILETTRDRLRCDLAIYRLYRYCDWSPHKISDLTLFSKTQIQRIIGEVFKMLCLSDGKCVFRKYFEK